MKHNYLHTVSVETARETLFCALLENGYTQQTETIPVYSACGRILAQAVYAKICAPHYCACAMDGIAVRAELTFLARENAPVFLSPEQYTVVDTGDPLPGAADAVVMAEDVTECEGAGGTVKLIQAVSPWQNVRQIGEDICMGDMIAPSRTVLTPALCAAMLTGGITEVSVIKKPVFGIVPTGDEIVKPTDSPKTGEIIESNSTLFSSMLQQWDAQGKVYDIVKDKKELILASVRKALDECDGVLILAGSSAGRDDYTSEVIQTVGELLVHGIAAKPGKPTVLGVSAHKPVIGLPGYPVSAIVAMEEFVKPVTELYYGKRFPAGETVEAVLARKLPSSLKYCEYIRVSVAKTATGYHAVPLQGGAGVITSFTKASGVLEIPQDSEGYEAGETVTVRLLRDKKEIDNSLIITGSHDPIIDEITELISSADTHDAAAGEAASVSVFSTHAGSMGAIRAVKEHHAHMGAVHLLDEETGEYNKSYVEKYFPNAEAVLFKGVGRIQGFMVQKGNPLDIRDFRDILRCRYVNRQRGAGTRLLCDHLIKKYGLDRSAIQGYNNEKFTHTAVAAFIASGHADAGLGIYSAAKMYGLDFIPVCNEEYDFLVDSAECDHPYVKLFFEVLHSDALKKRLDELGGYSISD